MRIPAQQLRSRRDEVRRWKSLNWRHDANHRFLVTTKSHTLIQATRIGVAMHDVQERCLMTPQRPPDQCFHQPAGVAPALKIRMGADPADLAQPACGQALTRHRDQARPFETAQVVAQLDGTRAERPRMGGGHQPQHLLDMLTAKLARPE